MFPIIFKRLYKNGIICLMTRDLDVLYASGIKYSVTYRQNCLILLRFENYLQEENTYDYL